MPQRNIDYSKCMFYKLVCKDLSIKDCYVGQTTDFKTRKAQHKSDSALPESHNGKYKVYQKIRETGGWDNWDMVLIEQRACGNALEAKALERYWMETLNANLNKVIPGRTKQEQVQCECGAKHKLCSKPRHMKSEMHQKWLEKQSTSNNIENERDSSNGGNAVISELEICSDETK